MDAFHKAGMSGPTLGVAKYDQPLTFRLLFSKYKKIRCLKQLEDRFLCHFDFYVSVHFL